MAIRKVPAMSKRKQTIVGIIVIELLLAGGWIWLNSVAATSPNATRDTARAIGEVFGGAMGLIVGLSPVLYLVARRNDLRAANRTKT
jgi:hypothetical protein